MKQWEPLTAEEQGKYVADAKHLLSHRVVPVLNVTNLAKRELRWAVTVNQYREASMALRRVLGLALQAGVSGFITDGECERGYDATAWLEEEGDEAVGAGDGIGVRSVFA